MLLFDEAPWTAETSLPGAFLDDFPNRILLQHGSALKKAIDSKADQATKGCSIQGTTEMSF